MNEPSGEQAVRPGGVPIAIWIILSIVLLIFLICAGGLVFTYYLFEDSWSQEPESVEAVARSITEIQVPADMEPLFALDLAEMVGTRMVVYGTQPETEEELAGQLMIMEFPQEPRKDRDEMKQEMERSLRERGEEGEDIEIAETEERTYMVRGEEQTVYISRGTDEEGRQVVQAFVPFTSKQGRPAMLMLLVPEQEWEESKFEGMLGSMR